MTTAVADIVPHPAARRHRWGDRKITCSVETSDGNERQTRVCILCGMTCITVIPPHGFAWHEWVHSGGMTAQLESTPPCLDLVASGGAEVKAQ